MPQLLLVSQMPSQSGGGHSTTQAQLLAEYFRSDGYGVKSVSRKSGRAARMLDVVLSIIRNRNSIDIMLIEVYSGLSFVLADIGSWVGKMIGIPSVLVLHGGNLPDFASDHPRWVRRVLARARVVAAPSSFLAEAMGKDGQSVRVIPNVVSEFPSAAPKRIDEPKLLWMRSFHPIYNPMMAVEMFSLLKQKFPKATMVMAGSDKGLEKATRQYVIEKGLADSISFPGFLDPEGKAKEFTEANIYINTNTIDNSPVSVIEAWAYGLPVISTDVGGIPHIVRDGENGLLVRSGDAEGMALKLERLIDDAELADSLTKNGLESARASSWDSVGPLWATVFDDVRRKAEAAEIEQLA